MFCPGWMFDVASARVAREYLAAELPMETFGKKYANFLTETYSEVSVEQLTGCAMSVLEFLSEIEAGDMSVELIDHYCHDRLHFEKVGVPRRMKSMFGNVEDAVKTREYSQELLQKSFRTFVFRLRSDPTNMSPPGWLLEEDVNIPKFSEVVGQSVSFLDSL